MKNSSPSNNWFQGFYIQVNTVINSDTIYNLEVKAMYGEDYMHKMDLIITFFTKIINNQAFETEQNSPIVPLSCNLKKEKAELRYTISL